MKKKDTEASIMPYISDEVFENVVHILSGLDTYDYDALSTYISDREDELRLLKMIQGEIGG